MKRLYQLRYKTSLFIRGVRVPNVLFDRQVDVIAVQLKFREAVFKVN